MNESALISKFIVDISAGSKDQLIAKNHPFWTQIRTSDGKRMNGLQTYTSSIELQEKNNDFYVIPADKTVQFSVKTTYDPKRMFAGTYFDILEQVTLGDYSRSQSIAFMSENKTSSVTIIG